MAGKIMITIYGKEIALADIAKYTNTNSSWLRDYYTKFKDKISTEEIIIEFIKNRYSHFLDYGFFEDENGNRITPEEYAINLVNRIYERSKSKDNYLCLRSKIDEQCIQFGVKYGIDKSTLKRYYTSNLKKADKFNVSWTVEKAAQEIIRKPQFFTAIKNLGLYNDIIKSRLENIYSNNHLIMNNADLIDLIKQDRLCNIPLRKELRKRCIQEGIAETTILTMLNKYQQLSLDEIIQGFKNKTLRRI